MVQSYCKGLGFPFERQCTLRLLPVFGFRVQGFKPVKLDSTKDPWAPRRIKFRVLGQAFRVWGPRNQGFRVESFESREPLDLL